LRLRLERIVGPYRERVVNSRCRPSAAPPIWRVRWPRSPPDFAQQKHDGSRTRYGRNAAPAKARGPPLQHSAAGSVDPGFPLGSSPWAEGPRESAIMAVSSRTGRPAGAQLAMTAPIWLL
jgi:hypothetical protein